MKHRLTFLMIAIIIIFPLMPSPTIFAATYDDTSFREIYQQYQQLLNGNYEFANDHYITPNKPTAYLTFDDGPSAVTPIVLNILKEENIQATFFVLGEHAEKRPELIERMVEDGHTIGNHTYNHVYEELYSSFAIFWEQIQRTEEILYSIIRERPVHIRAPGGSFTNFDAFYYYYLEQAGYHVHDWNIDSGDSKRRGVSAEEIIHNVTNSHFTHEINVLLHDSSGHLESADALREIIHILREKGYEFAPLTEDVKPIQFRVADQLKWNRSIAYTEHLTYMETAQQLLEAPSSLVHANHTSEIHSTEVDIEPIIKDQMKNVTLSDLPLFTQLSQLVHPSISYKQDLSKYKISVRALAEQLGGVVTWDENQRKATIRHGSKVIEYHIDTQVMEITSPQQGSKVIHQASFTLEDGSIIVPLHSTLELLRGRYV